MQCSQSKRLFKAWFFIHVLSRFVISFERGNCESSKLVLFKIILAILGWTAISIFGSACRFLQSALRNLYLHFDHAETHLTFCSMSVSANDTPLLQSSAVKTEDLSDASPSLLLLSPVLLWCPSHSLFSTPAAVLRPSPFVDSGRFLINFPAADLLPLRSVTYALPSD